MHLSALLAHGLQGVIVAGAVEASTAATSDHQVTVAVITAAAGLLGVIIAPLVTDRVRDRRTRVDHDAESREELDDLTRRFLRQLEDKDDEIRELRAQLRAATAPARSRRRA